ncbi:GDSL esterase/lipase At1g71250-like [Euphorbia lathyris]|uniref:GDSL esterase/lipase At1g71250-like n=1 Tax=Euphorbia lathyris TaxID=212925 RepID=UPI0033130D81
MGTPNMSSLLSILLVFTFISPLSCYSQGNETKIKGMFVFGSSLVDNGNNNFLQTKAKANFWPYGIDFPYGSTGRFTNGKNVIDLLSDHLGLPFIPPFYHPSTTGANITHGVDFASAASGILDFTGTVSGNVTGLNKQIENFVERTLPALETQLGIKSDKFLRNYMFVVGIGGNDYTNNYFARPMNQTLQAFTNNLILALSAKFKILYNLGGRKFVLMSANPLGCYPIKRRNGSKCIKELNEAALLYNSQLKSLVDHMNQQFPDSHFVFVNSYHIIMDIINNHTSLGFQNVKEACFDRSSNKVCVNRKQYVFFDGVHPTQAVNLIIASKAFFSNLQSEVYPININQLSMF